MLRITALRGIVLGNHLPSKVRCVFEEPFKYTHHHCEINKYIVAERCGISMCKIGSNAFYYGRGDMIIPYKRYLRIHLFPMDAVNADTDEVNDFVAGSSLPNILVPDWDSMKKTKNENSYFLSLNSLYNQQCKQEKLWHLKLINVD
jgi:hypothetical protein